MHFQFQATDAAISELFSLLFRAWKVSPDKSEFHIFMRAPYPIFAMTTFNLKIKSEMTALP